MAVSRFAVQISNVAERPQLATVRLEPMSPADLAATGYTFPAGSVRIRTARMSMNAPSSALACFLDAIWTAVLGIVFTILRRPYIAKPFRQTVAAQTEGTATVVIDAIGDSGATGVRVIDRRGSVDVGGVTLLVVRGRVVPPPTAEIPNLCPLEVDREPYWLAVDSLADDPPLLQPIPTGAEVQLVAWISNRSETTLDDATVYLEHLGTSRATFVPRFWNLGSVAPGVQIPLTWRVAFERGSTRDATATIVVTSDRTNPRRLRVPFKLTDLPDEAEAQTDIAGRFE